MMGFQQVNTWRLPNWKSVPLPLTLIITSLSPNPQWKDHRPWRPQLDLIPGKKRNEQMDRMERNSRGKDPVSKCTIVSIFLTAVISQAPT